MACVARIGGVPQVAAIVAGMATFSANNGETLRERQGRRRCEAGQMQQGQDTILRRLGKALHVFVDDIAHEPLPRRWIELIHCLDERERERTNLPQGDKQAGKRSH
jgi:hypothetical protein